MNQNIRQKFKKKDPVQAVRINKFLSEAGVCSRREADRLLAQGRVTIDGKTAGVGDKVMRSQLVLVDHKPVNQTEEMVLIAFNKPAGIVCTAEKREKHNIIDYIGYPQRIYPVGRLDKDSQGLILLTNNGDIVNKMMRSGNYHEKEYIVTVNKPVTPEFTAAMAGGVPILDTVTRECLVEKTGKFTFRIVITQGLNRQIRRMCEYLGYRVTKLVRIRIMNIRLDNLKEGTYRNITDKELETLGHMISGSSNTTVYGGKNGR